MLCWATRGRLVRERTTETMQLLNVIKSRLEAGNGNIHTTRVTDCAKDLAG